jgi:hypothetical protein
MSHRPRTSARLFAVILLAASSSALAEEKAAPERETMDRMRTIAAALQSRWEDMISGSNEEPGPANAALRPGDPPNLVRVPPRKDRFSAADVVEFLQPREDLIYLHEIPSEDAWGGRIEVYFDLGHVCSERVITVRSAGANRRFDGESYEIGAFEPGGTNDDIVIADKRFVRWPRGVPEEELAIQAKP